jgi:hypothetical protein
VAWLHTMHMEGGQTQRLLSDDEDDDHPFGVKGRDYDPSYHVTITPLYAHPASAPENARGEAVNGVIPIKMADGKNGWKISPETLEAIANKVDGDGWDCGQWEGIEGVLLAVGAQALAHPASAPAPAEGAGWSLVPVEPTPEMIEAAAGECRRLAGVIDPVMHVWDAMLAAAPATTIQSTISVEAVPVADDAAGSIAYAKVKIDTPPRAGWAFVTPSNHPDDVERGLVEGDWNEMAQFFGEVYATPPAARSEPAAEMGKVFTYQNQPDNTVAWRIGEACFRAKPGGDWIDHGLYFLQELEKKGYGVVALSASPKPSTQEAGDA